MADQIPKPFQMPRPVGQPSTEKLEASTKNPPTGGVGPSNAKPRLGKTK